MLIVLRVIEGLEDFFLRFGKVRRNCFFFVFDKRRIEVVLELRV